MGIPITEKELESLIVQKLSANFAKDASSASKYQLYISASLVIRDFLMNMRRKTLEKINSDNSRKVHYLSMEFLIGASLKNNIANLEISDIFERTISNLGFSADEIYSEETDAGLGNGGLGRLAACYLDSLSSLGLPATGYSILYEHGIFKQKILDGAQVELPDNWLEKSDVWLLPQKEETEEVRFGGRVEAYTEGGQLKFAHRDYSTVLAVPHDITISGFSSETVNTLRLWSARSANPIDMSLFSRGEYVRALEDKAITESISKILYPEDNHYSGKVLRLKQQYFFVSATISSIVKAHKKKYGTMKNFAEKSIIHINDTHPTLAIPELMRQLLDNEGFGWDEAFEIVSSCMAYTNHTIMAEALERWPIQMFRELLPRIYMIVEEINRRFNEKLKQHFPNDHARVEKLAIIGNNEIRMANLCISACFSVNGVSELHSNILKENIFSDYDRIFPKKFGNVTNGIAHRRWLCQANPALSAFVTELIGDSFMNDAEDLRNLLKFTEDKSVIARLSEIKRENKLRFVKHLGAGIDINPDSIFDIQAKRLHEYKRQLLSVLHIVYEYHQLLENPNMNFTPKTYFFAAKSAAGYAMAKDIIRLINSVASEINSNPKVSQKLKVVFVEDYSVSLAEVMIPSAEISEQISVAGKEASGTGNMKFMLNGALTIGTLDGANVEICDAVGRENIYIFGLTAEETKSLIDSGRYSPMEYYHNNPQLRRVLDNIRDGIGNGATRRGYPEIVNSLLQEDRYLLLCDFDSYCKAHERIHTEYSDKALFTRKSLINIANSGRFSSDRSILEYAKNIWNLKKL